jgi:hypothetical protein
VHISGLGVALILKFGKDNGKYRGLHTFRCFSYEPLILLEKPPTAYGSFKKKTLTKFSYSGLQEMSFGMVYHLSNKISRVVFNEKIWIQLTKIHEIIKAGKTILKANLKKNRL